MANIETDKRLIPVIEQDCKCWMAKRANDVRSLSYNLHLHEYENSENTGLYGLYMTNDFFRVEKELCYGTLREINAVVKAMCRLADWGF